MFARPLLFFKQLRGFEWSLINGKNKYENHKFFLSKKQKFLQLDSKSNNQNKQIERKKNIFELSN